MPALEILDMEISKTDYTVIFWEQKQDFLSYVIISYSRMNATRSHRIVASFSEQFCNINRNKTGLKSIEIGRRENWIKGL